VRESSKQSSLATARGLYVSRGPLLRLRIVYAQAFVCKATPDGSSLIAHGQAQFVLCAVRSMVAKLGPDVLGLQQLACVDFWRCEAVDAGPD
jgi:hypothetical protein